MHIKKGNFDKNFPLFFNNLVFYAKISTELLQKQLIKRMYLSCLSCEAELLQKQLIKMKNIKALIMSTELLQKQLIN